VKKTLFKTNQHGFSLLEIVVTLIVSAFLGTIFVSYLGTSLMKSAEPVVMIQEGYSLNQIMESITADYKNLLILDETPLTTLESYVVNGNVPENNPYYGTYTVETGYILFSGGNEVSDTEENRILKVKIISNDQSLIALFTK
jgi:prepilin-type N-terminal cleavage/methylation domain-containing protein